MRTMSERPDPTSLEGFISLLGHVDDEYDYGEDKRRENGLKLLEKLGVSLEARTIVVAAYVVNDMGYSRPPAASLEDVRIVRLAREAVVHAKTSALQGGLDLRAEIATLYDYLEAVENTATSSRFDEGGDLPLRYIDEVLDPLVEALKRALSYI